MSTEPTPQKRRRRSKSKQNTNFRIGLWLIGGLFVVALAAIVAISMLSPSAEEISNFDSGTEWTGETDEESFEQFLTNASNDRLAREFSNLQDDEEAELPVRFGVLEKRLAVAESLLGSSPDGEQEKLALREKLDAMMTRLLIGLEQKGNTGHFPADLGLFLDTISGSPDEQLELNSYLGRILIDVDRLLRSNSDEEGRLNSLNEKFKGLIEKDSNDSFVAEQLFRYLRLVYDHSKLAAGQLLQSTLEEGYSSSTDELIKRLLVATKRSNLIQINEFENIADAGFSGRDAAIQRLVGQIEKTFSGEDVQREKIPMAFERVHDLLMFGRAKEARDALAQINKVSAPDVATIVANRTQVLEAKIASFETAFDIGGAKDFKTSNAFFQNENAEYKVLFMVTEKTYGDGVLKFDELLHTLRDPIVNDRVEIAIIYLDGHNKSKAYKDLKKFGLKSDKWRVWYVDTTEPDGRQLAESVLPIRKIPHIIVLAGDTLHVEKIGPPILDVGRLFESE